MTFFDIFFKKIILFLKTNLSTPPSPVHSLALARASREVE